MSNYSQELVEKLTRIRKEYRSVSLKSKCLRPYLDEIMMVTNWMPVDIFFTARIHVIINKIYSIPKCLHCGNDTMFLKNYQKFSMFCCLDCSRHSEHTRQKTREVAANRTEEEKQEIYKKVSSTINNKSDEEKQEIYKKIGAAWGDKSAEELQEINQKRTDAWANKTEEEKLLINESRAASREKWTDEERQYYIDKMIETRASWTDEHKEEVYKKVSDTINNKTDEQKQERNNKMLLSKSLWTDEYKKEISDKISAAIKISYMNKSDEQKQKEVGKIKEAKSNWTPERRKEAFDKMIETKSKWSDERKKDVISRIMRTCFKSKDYILPSGNIIKLQGYEPWALDELLNIYNEEDIITCSQTPIIIPYIFEGKNKSYFPDIFIPKENKIIEIKSTWTYDNEIGQNIAKFEATKNAGYIFECWIYNGKKEKTIIY